MKHEPGMAYNTKTLNKVFAILSISLLLVTIWMVLDDYIRPWKAIQVKALDIEKQKITTKLASIEKSIDQKSLEEVLLKLESAKKEIEKKKTEVSKINQNLTNVRNKIYVQNMINGTMGSQASAYQFKYEHALMENHPEEAKKLNVTFKSFKEKEMAGKDKLKGLIAEETKLINQIKEIEESKTVAEKELKTLIGEKELAEKSLSLVDKDPVFFLRNSPFIDFLDPTIKIRQYVIKNATDDRYFQHVPKIDRCTTCHVFIDKPGFEDQDNPYRTHPNLDLQVSANSPHPVKEFGCTSCHGGVGDRVHDFNSPVHVPQNKEQEIAWTEKYHWHQPHKIPEPMLPLQHTEAMCLKCHQGVEQIPKAAKLNQGRKLIETYGCYGCHKIEGWQHLEKPGPSLEKITAKVSPEWMKNWIWSPHSFNEKSKMPAFFNQANNSSPEFKIKNMAEVNAMVVYLTQNAQPYKPHMKYVPGNSQKGKELIETIGCTSCHMVEGIDEKWNKIGARKGTYLTGTGSKVNPDWLVSWLKKPSHYQEDTVMPSFRLTDKEANDIASYLLSLKNEQFASLEFPELNEQIRDEILVQDYFSAFETIAAAKEKLSTLSNEERTLELGKRSINKYGCYSCHNIVGFDGDLPQIGPELTKEGSKPVEQFGFGHQKHVPHTRLGWLTQHLKQPSIWDVGVPKPFKDLNKMPNFYLQDWEIDSIVTSLLGQVATQIPLVGQKRLDANEKLAEAGKKVANKYNCQGCHQIDGLGGEITQAFDDLNYAPPYLVKEGHRVQSDWLYNFLKNVHPIRSYVNIRMPSFNFTHEEVNQLVTYFQADAHQPTFEEPAKIEWAPGEKEAAKKLFNELACTTCHTQGFTKEDPLAPNLHYIKKRLRTSWIEKWLKNPAGILPYTSMPAFWDGGDGELMSAVDGVLENDPQRQIEAVKKYILEMSYDESPKPHLKN